MFSTLFSAQFIVFALFINMFVFLFGSELKKLLTKNEGDNPDFGIPKVLTRNIIMILVFIISFILTVIVGHFGTIMLISDSIFITSAWNAVLSTFTYNIGMKEILVRAKTYVYSKYNKK